MRIDLHERLERSALMHFDSLSRSNVKSSGLYVRRRRERAVTRERFPENVVRHAVYSYKKQITLIY